MRELTRRTVLGLFGTTVTAGVASTGAVARANGKVERVLSTGQLVPENLGFDAEGNLYVGITGGSVRRLPAYLVDETDLGLKETTEVATYPGGVAGVLVSNGTLYTAVNGDTGSVYEYEIGNDDAPTEVATLLPGSNGFVNDLYADDDRLLVTESFGGTVYEVPRDGSDATVWVQNDLLDTVSFGANGITRIGDEVYVAVTRVDTDSDGEPDAGRIVRVPVTANGDAGTPETYAEDEALLGADGLTARCPQLYVAVNQQNRVTRITPSQQLRTVVEGDPLSFPSEVVFDSTRSGKAFICNFSPENSDAAGVLRTHP